MTCSFQSFEIIEIVWKILTTQTVQLSFDYGVLILATLFNFSVRNNHELSTHKKKPCHSGLKTNQTYKNFPFNFNIDRIKNPLKFSLTFINCDRCHTVKINIMKFLHDMNILNLIWLLTFSFWLVFFFVEIIHWKWKQLRLRMVEMWLVNE